MRKFGILALAALFPAWLFAARLTLRDGNVYYGRLVSGSEDTIVFQDQNGVNRRFDTNTIRTLDFDAGDNPSGQYNNRDNNRNDNDRSDNGRYVGSANRNAGELETLDAGTMISVRTDQEIQSDSAAEGRTYPAAIAEDVTGPNGRVIIPRGSEAELVIRQVNEGGRISGGNLVLDLQSVRINGTRYNVSTEDVQQGNANGIGANRRTAEMVGGGAVLGTLLGAVAGGGKGAAIGAIAGAAAGGGVQVLTKGSEIRVPAESVLNFRLDQPLRLTAAR